MIESQVELDAPANTRTMRIGFGGYQVVIRSTDAAVIDALGTAFVAMPPGPDLKPAGLLEVDLVGGRYLVEGVPHRSMADGSLRDAIRCLRYAAIRLLIDARPDCFWLHAAVAARGGQVLLLPGGRGAGNGTLVTSLCGKGWQYLSDDVAPLDLASGTLLPFPLFPEVRGYTSQAFPESLEAGAFAAPMPVGVIVHPVYRPRMSAELMPWSAAECARYLLDHSWNVGTVGERAAGLVSRLLERVPSYQLHFHTGAEAATLLTGEGPNPTEYWVS